MRFVPSVSYSGGEGWEDSSLELVSRLRVLVSDVKRYGGAYGRGRYGNEKRRWLHKEDGRGRGAEGGCMRMCERLGVELTVVHEGMHVTLYWSFEAIKSRAL